MAKLQSINSVAGKETLYVDVDDEITAIIDKVGAAKGKVVALVLPKRAPVLQSIVNMKLLKRTAENAGKNLVLVTNETGLMPLAGAVGIHVASTPSSKPSIPDAPSGIGNDDGTEELEEPIKVVDGNEQDDADDDFDPKAAAATSVGELAAIPDDDETIDMGNEPDELPAVAAVTSKLPKLKKPKKDKSLKVPNFNRFRKLLVLGVLLLILLIVAWIFAFTVLPKASVTIGTDSSTIPTNLTLSLDTTATSLDTTNDIVPAISQSEQKTQTQTVNATGQQNNGTKATGTVTMSAGSCSGTVPNDVAAGTTLTANSNTYVLDDTVTFTPTVAHGSKACTFTGQGSNGESDIPITALSGGSSSNVSSASFTVTNNTGVSASGSASGGTDSIVTIVQQSDIENATSKVSAIDTSVVKQELESDLEAKGLLPIPVTFLAGTPQVTTNQQAGAQASSVTATAVTSYTMLGVQKSNLQTLVDGNVEGQLDKGKQVILDDGIENAQYAEGTPGTATTATIAMSVESQAGPQLNVNSLKTQLAGMKNADVQSYIKQTPGVTNVTVHFSPFWVDSIPKNTSKVTITIKKAGS